MRQLKKLPIGTQTFVKIREENYLYVDKTAIAQQLIEQYHNMSFYHVRVGLVRVYSWIPCRIFSKAMKRFFQVW